MESVLTGNRVLQGLAGLEHRGLGGGDGNGLLGLGVAAHPLGAGLDLKGPKAHQLYLLVLAQRIGDRLDGGGDGGLGVLLGELGLLSDCRDQFSLVW